MNDAKINELMDRINELTAQRDALKSALQSALESMQDALTDADDNAYLVCCGRGGTECCGCPDTEWSAEDRAVMDALGPIENELSKSLREIMASIESSNGE